MEYNITTLCAYHESARVVFAYLSGYTCDGIELSDTDPGKGKSKLNGGPDNALIQQILAGNYMAVGPENRNKALETAMHLMEIYCAGACAQAYFEKDGIIGADIELDLPVQDERPITAIQQFLTGINPKHDQRFAAQKMGAVIHKLKDAAIWKPISLLAVAAINKQGQALSRFEIEDALMAGGMKLKKTAPQAFNVGLTDTGRKKEEPVAPQPKSKSFDAEPVADILLKDFFRKIRRDWAEDDVEAAVKRVKEIVAGH